MPVPYTTTPARFTCTECGFSSSDEHLVKNHSCDVVEHGGYCEDFPACGHENGDCNGLLYGSDEAIKDQAMKHYDCEHEQGICRLEDDYDKDDEGDKDK